MQILELKDTLDLSGDALLQAIADYEKIVAREKVRGYIPVLLNPIASGSLKFPYCSRRCCIAVCVGPIYVSKVLALDLSLGFHGLREHRPPGPCLPCFVALLQTSPSILRWGQQLGGSQTLLSVSQSDTRRSFQSPPSLSTSNFCREPVNRLQLLWTSGTQPRPCTSPLSILAR